MRNVKKVPFFLYKIKLNNKYFQVEIETQKMSPTNMQRIFDTEHNYILKNSRLLFLSKLPTFDDSGIFWLEKLGEGGFGIVQKAYEKHNTRFIAVKTFKKKSDPAKFKEIILEDALLQSIEEVRAADGGKFNNCFLQYDGAFQDPKDNTAVILKMESGIATLQNVLDAGKTYSCAELAYVHQKVAEGFMILENKNIANRDVKPDNLILVKESKEDDEEETFLYKISDFGIGCHLEAGLKIIPASDIKGLTKIYAAPEILGIFLI